jgi:hypothetical protein
MFPCACELELGCSCSKGFPLRTVSFQACHSVSTMCIDSFMALTRCSSCDMVPAKQKVEVLLLRALAAGGLSQQLTR